MALYPAQIDNVRSLPLAPNNNSPTPGSVFNRLREAVLQIETELGIKPSGSYGSVEERFFYLESIVGNLKIIELRGDFGGTLRDPKVIQLQGRPFSDVEPGFNELITWNGIAWAPQNINAVLPQATSAGQVMTWNGENWIASNLNTGALPEADMVGQVVIWDGTSYIADQLTQDDILPGYRFDILNSSDKFIIVGKEQKIYFAVDYDINPESVNLYNDQDDFVQDVTAPIIADKKFFTDNSYVKNNFNEKVKFTFSVVKGRANKYYEKDVIWGQPLFWGVGDMSTFDGPASSFIATLNKKVSNTIDHVFQVSPESSQKVYFACRSAYGNALFTVNNLYGGFNKILTFNLNNGYGFEEDFDLYESDYPGLGNITVNVSLDPFPPTPVP